MIRKLFWIVIVVGIATLLSRLLGRSRSQPTPRQAPAPRFEGAMVRDRVCRTFVLRARALSLRCGDEEHFFCSEACRETFLSTQNRARAS